MKRATFNLRYIWGLSECRGYVAEVPELEATVVLQRQGRRIVTGEGPKWGASEYATGLYLAGGDTPTGALAEFKRVVEKAGGKARLQKVIAKCIKKQGRANEATP